MQPVRCSQSAMPYLSACEYHGLVEVVKEKREAGGGVGHRICKQSGPRRKRVFVYLPLTIATSPNKYTKKSQSSTMIPAPHTCAMQYDKSIIGQVVFLNILRNSKPVALAHVGRVQQGIVSAWGVTV